MKGGGLFLVIAAIGTVFFLFVTGRIPGYGQGAPKADGATDAAKEAGSEAAKQGGALAEWYFSHGWAYTALVAAALATIGIVTWRKIGGWGRAFVIVCAAIAFTVLVTR